MKSVLLVRHGKAEHHIQENLAILVIHTATVHAIIAW